MESKSRCKEDMDPTWQWCERVKENNRLKLKCSFCGNTFSGGISRMKHHLAGTSKDASPCGGGPNKPLPPFVRQQCLEMLHDLRQKRIQKEIEEADVGCNEPLEDEEAYECDDEDDSSLRTDLETSRGRDRRGKWIMYEGGRSSITGRKRRGTADIRARCGMRPPSGRVPTDSREQDAVGNELDLYDTCYRGMGQPVAVRASTTMRPGHRKRHIIEEDGPTNKSRKYITWEEDDSMVMSWIMNSVQPQIASTITYYTTAKEM
ncbi:hypothetical protein EJ110_NYTH53440 [Nymphaea thermarum]|nr:hypothetical protein EJ110_NYTH53440 [Nymphaea thermarum]